jgi:hypothetical protein
MTVVEIASATMYISKWDRLVLAISDLKPMATEF